MSVEAAKAWLDLVLAVSAVILVVVGALRWGNRRLENKIISELRDATRQIQPNTNGGKSLADLHGKIDGLCRDVEALRIAVLTLEDDVAAIEQDLEAH